MLNANRSLRRVKSSRVATRVKSGHRKNARARACARARARARRDIPLLVAVVTGSDYQ
jgi:hypothetical protein